MSQSNPLLDSFRKALSKREASHGIGGLGEAVHKFNRKQNVVPESTTSVPIHTIDGYMAGVKD